MANDIGKLVKNLLFGDRVLTDQDYDRIEEDIADASAGAEEAMAAVGRETEERLAGEERIERGLAETAAVAAASVSGVVYDDRVLSFSKADGSVLTVDCSDFVRDGMLSSAAVEGRELVLTFNTDAEQAPVSIDLSAIFDPDSYYDKKEIDLKFDQLNYKDITVTLGDYKTLEKGSSVKDPTFTVAFNNQKPTAVTWRGAPAPELSGKTSGSVSAAGTWTQDQTWQLSAHHESQAGSSNASKTTGVRFRNRIFWGAAEIPDAFDSAFVRRLGLSAWASGSDSDGSRSVTSNAGEGEYFWYASPSAFGERKFVTNLGPEDLSARTVRVDIGGTSAEDYYLYRGTEPNTAGTAYTVSKK